MVLMVFLVLLCIPGWVHAHQFGPRPVTSTDVASGTLFASPTGSGSTCSEAVPCSLSTIAAQASAGAIAFLRGGLYTITENLYFANDGTWSAPITYESYPGETATLDGGTLAEGTAVYVYLTGDHNVLRKLVIANMPATGLFIIGNYNLIDGLFVHGNKSGGIIIHDTSYTTPYGALASYNIIRDTTTSDNSDAVLGDGGNSDGISVSSGIGNQILYCLAEHNSDDGFDTWRSQNTRISYSIAVNNGIDSGNGNGFKGGGIAASSGTRIDHSLAYNNRGAGFTVNTGVDVQFSYNTAWDNDGVGFAMCDGSAQCVGNGMLLNSISLGNSADTDGTALYAQNNSWQREGAALSFYSVSPTSKYFLHHVPGTFIDIGAYQSASGDPAATRAVRN